MGAGTDAATQKIGKGRQTSRTTRTALLFVALVGSFQQVMDLIEFNVRVRWLGWWLGGYLSVGVAEDDGHQAALKSVKEGVDVVIDFDPLAAFVRRSVDCHHEVQSEQRNQHQCRPHRFSANKYYKNY